MEEKDQNKLTVEDILNQLVKPSVVGMPASKTPAQSVPYESGFSSGSIKPKILPRTESNIKLPTLKAGIDKFVPKPTETTTTSPLQPSEIRLSIRTMADDIDKLKEGERPTGLEVSKTLNVERTQKDQKPLQVLADIPSQIRPLESKLRLPEKLFPEKSSIPIKTPLPSIGKPPLQESLIARPPQKSSVAELVEEKVEYKAIVRVVSSGMTMGVLTTIIVAVAIYFLLSLFVFNQENITIPTFTPVSTTGVPIPEANELETIFNFISEVSFLFPESSQEVIPKFKLFVNNQAINKNQFKRVNFSVPGQTEKPKFIDILKKLLINIPSELAGQMKNSNAVFIYGQQEIFDENGKSIFGELGDGRLVFIVEVKNRDRTLEVMKSWELTMPSNLKDIFDLNILKEASLNFLDNKYQGVSIRYKNFPFPDRSIDYAVVTSLTGRYYLLIANSRESTYSPISKILGIQQ